MSQSKPGGRIAVGDQRVVAPLLLIVDAAEVDSAQLALGDVFLGGHVVGGAAVLRAHLDDPLVLPGGLDQLAALPAVVAQRLLDVHVLARLAAPDGGRHVPVVGRGDDHGVDRLVVQGLAEVLHALRAPCRPGASAIALAREANSRLSTSQT